MRPYVLLLLASASLAFAAVPQPELDGVRQLLSERKLAEAEAAAQKLVASYPAEADAYLSLGTVRMSKEDPENAVKNFERAAELQPASSEVQRRLGDACGFAAQKAGMLSKMGWAKRCRAAYEKSVELDPKNIPARLSLMGYYQQAPSLVGGGMDKAYAQLYAADKKYSEAFGLFEEVLLTQPDNYLSLFQIGRLAAMSGDRVDRGIETLRKALALAPTPGAAGHEAAHWRLGMLFEKKGDKAAARTAYEAALKLNPKFQQAIDSLKKLG